MCPNFEVMRSVEYGSSQPIYVVGTSCKFQPWSNWGSMSHKPISIIPYRSRLWLLADPSFINCSFLFLATLKTFLAFLWTICESMQALFTIDYNVTVPPSWSSPFGAISAIMFSRSFTEPYLGYCNKTSLVNSASLNPYIKAQYHTTRVDAKNGGKWHYRYILLYEKGNSLWSH